MDRLSIITLAAAKAYANKKVEALEQVVRYIGVTTTEITDGSTTNPITINGQSVTAVAGDTVFYNGTSYAWDGSAWQEVMNIAEIITAVEALGGKVHDILADIAPEFDSTETYSVDDVVLYEDDLYIFTAEHTGAWDSADVDVTSLANIIEDIRTELSDKQDALPLTFSGNDITANGSLFAGNEIIDGQGNTLSVLAEALTKTASGNPVVISDCAGGKARSLKTTIEAIQDLHGLPFPYVGGAYKNKFNPNFTGVTGITPSVDSNGYLILTVSGAVSATFLKGQSIALKANTAYTLSCAGASSDVKVSLRNSDGSTIYASVEVDGGSSTYTPTEDITVYFYIRVETSAALTATLKPQLEEGASATAFVKWANICPISGRTEARVDDTGINLFGIDASRIGKDYDNGNTPERFFQTFALPKGAYIWKMNGSASGMAEVTCGVADAPIPFSNINAHTVRGVLTTQSPTKVITITDEYPYAFIGVRKSSGTITLAEIEAVKLQLEVGDTATAYTPYVTPTNATIQLGQTVYGADINWDTGVATVKNKYKDITKNDISDNGTAGGLIEAYVNGTSDKANGLTNMLCNPLTVGSTAAAYVIRGRTTSANVTFCLPTDVTPDFEAVKTWVVNNPIQLVYELANPITIQLTPSQLELLKGYNRVTIDNGTITLDYVAKAISGNDEEIAPLVGDKATKSYAVNDFIERADGLYRVTAPIASGASFTANNTVKMSIGEALTYLYNK